MRTKQSHKKSIADFSKALQLPAQILVIHCRAHIEQRDEVSKCNNFTDTIAKAAVRA